MKIKDLIAAVRDYPALRQALEESNTELDLSRMECAQLQSKINELEPLVDEYYQESCGKEYAANQERQKVETLKKCNPCHRAGLPAAGGRCGAAGADPVRPTGESRCSDDSGGLI